MLRMRLQMELQLLIGSDNFTGGETREQGRPNSERQHPSNAKMEYCCHTLFKLAIDILQFHSRFPFLPFDGNCRVSRYLSICVLDVAGERYSQNCRLLFRLGSTSCFKIAVQLGYNVYVHRISVTFDDQPKLIFMYPQKLHNCLPCAYLCALHFVLCVFLKFIFIFCSTVVILLSTVCYPAGRGAYCCEL